MKGIYVEIVFMGIIAVVIVALIIFGILYGIDMILNWLA